MTPEERRIRERLGRVRDKLEREGFFGGFPRWAMIFVMIAALLVVVVLLITKGGVI